MRALNYRGDSISGAAHLDGVQFYAKGFVNTYFYIIYVVVGLFGLGSLLGRLI